MSYQADKDTEDKRLEKNEEKKKKRKKTFASVRNTRKHVTPRRFEYGQNSRGKEPEKGRQSKNEDYGLFRAFKGRVKERVVVVVVVRKERN